MAVCTQVLTTGKRAGVRAGPLNLSGSRAEAASAVPRRNTAYREGDVTNTTKEQDRMRTKGKVKWFNDAMGFGFITPDSGE